MVFTTKRCSCEVKQTHANQKQVYEDVTSKPNEVEISDDIFNVDKF